MADKQTFNINERVDVSVSNGIYVSKKLIFISLLVVVVLLVSLPLIVYYTKPDVNFNKIKTNEALQQQTWNDICIEYACKNNNELNSKTLICLTLQE